MSDNVLIRLGDVCKNASRRFSPPEDGKVWFVNTGDVEKGRFTHNNLSDWDGLPGQAKKAIVPGDILYSEIRPGNGRYAFVDRNYPNAVVSTKFMVIEADDNILPKYLYHVITSPEIQRAMKLIAESRSGTFPQITFDSIAHLQFTLPPKSDQQAVSSLLDGIEKRIRNNQKMNQTLEEIAKAIFKSWFVDFDPVRAKAEGRPRGLPPEISDLFPDELVDSEIGEIPKGWEGLPLSEVIVEVGKKTRPTTETERRPYVPIDCISSKSLTLLEYKKGEEAKSSLVSFKKGDILFGAMRPYFHKVCIAPFDGTTRTTCLVLNSKARDYFGFSLFTLFLDSTIDFATQNSTGSTIPYIKWKNELETLIVPLPSVELAGKFNSLLEPILEKFSMGVRELEVLSELRDTLLPKLISGELRIPSAEKFLEEAGI